MMHGYYSKTQSKLFGCSVWTTLTGEEVVVSTVYDDDAHNEFRHNPLHRFFSSSSTPDFDRKHYPDLFYVAILDKFVINVHIGTHHTDDQK
jgi:hypothetical protein